MEFTDEFLGYLELKQDLLFDKIPKNQMKFYIDSSLEIGRNACIEMKGKTLKNLYDLSKIDIVYEEKSGQLFKTKLRAQFEKGKNGKDQVTIYKESIQNLAKLSGLTYEEALNIHLAHEYFHFWELEKNRPVNEILPKVPLTKLFGWQRYGTILRTSEIAANSFTKELLNLNTLPNFFDYKYLIVKKSIPEDWFSEAFHNYKLEIV
jgi:hypothetical protein